MARPMRPASVSQKDLYYPETILRAHYSLGDLIFAKQITRGHINVNYEIRISKSGKTDRYVLRIYRQGTGENRIAFEHALLIELGRRSFGFAPQPIRSKSGSTYVRVAGTYGKGLQGSYAAVFEYKGGFDKYDWDRPACTVAELQDAARVLAAYHHTIFGWDPDQKDKSVRIFNRLPALSERWKTYGRHVGDDIFNPYFHENRPFLIHLLNRLKQWCETVSTDDLPVIAVHGDYHPGNLKFQRGRITAVLDFDWSHMDYRVFDIGLAVIYFCTSWERENDGRIMRDKVDYFLAAYQKSAAQSARMGPLSSDEMNCLPMMILLADLFILDWTVEYFFTRNPDPHEYLRYLKHGVRAAKWWERHRRELDNAVTVFPTDVLT